jgi:regulator of protease activity HflC (stomatin/prohibitin superfamily)
MVGFAKNQFTRIKNPHTRKQTRDFEYSIYSFIFMVALAGAFSAVYVILAGSGLQEGALVRSSLALILAALTYLVMPRWSALIPAMLLAQMALFLPVPSGMATAAGTLDFVLGSRELLLFAGVLISVIFGPSLQVVLQWDKVVVLRLGRFRRVHDPGPFFLLPLLDRCAAFVDTRIRVTDFSAEKILTRDTVPVHVDALAFWMIWDARKAILEVEDFLEAVTLSAQTALRDSIGKYSLTTLLSERETLYREIQTILDAKTNPWGITILSVEFTDIVLPPELEDVMSKQAQAEREKEARLFLAKAEREVASEFTAAAEVYRSNPEALNLRAMNMVYDGIKNNGSLILLPSGALENMNLGSVMGVSGLAEAHRDVRRRLSGDGSDGGNRETGPGKEEPGAQPPESGDRD